MTLARRLALVIFSAASLAAIALAVVVYALSRDSVTSAIRERQLDSAKQLMGSIDRLLSERQNDIVAMAQDQAVENLTVQPGNEGVRAITNSRLTQLSTVTGPWESLSVVDRNDRITASIDAKLIGKSIKTDIQDLEVVHRALAGEAAFSDLLLDETTGKPSIMFAAPVRLEEKPGKPVVATVLGHLAWTEVIDVLKDVEVGSANLYNHAGIEIANKDDPSAILKEDRSDSVAIKRAQSQQSGSGILPGSDTPVETLTSYAFEEGYSNYKGNGWIIVMETPTAVAFAPANDASIKLVIALLIVIGAGAATAVFLVARAVRPVSSLTKSANRLAIGDLSHRFKVTSRDEFGQLGTALNNMADKLQALYKNLEAKVQEKTVRLAARTQEAETSAAKDEAILSSIGEGLVVVNNDSRVVRINTQALEIFGLSIENIIGKKVLDAITFFGERGEPLDDNERPTIAALSQGERTINTYQIKKANESKVLVAIISNPVKLKDQTVGAIMVVRDVTKEREVDRMKTEFISLASHQLRTPLSAIKWFTEMLVAGDAGKLTKEQQEFATNVYDSTQRMIELVNSLLNISRIESGRIIVDPHPTNIDKMVHGIVNDLKAKTEEKQQTLIVSVHSDLPEINLDARLIGQVYLNFLTNAIKYTPKGGEINVTVSRKGEDLVSQISDNGYGIPKEQQDRVFQKFFRAENAVKVETDGTGLGLYLVKAIIESSGGKVWFKSVENKGTTFWFSLPMSGMKAKEGEVTLDI